MDIMNEFEYYKARWEKKRYVSVQHTPELWDKRAEGWNQRLQDDTAARNTALRIQNAVTILSHYGLLQGDCDVIDIGCGPGRFVAEFAKTARHVTGTDFSQRMLDFGAEYAREQGIQNVDFVPCDFKKSTPAELGWEGKFDLVFTSMTPAISKYDSLEKMIAMSRGWCCNSCCVVSQSDLEETVAQELDLPIPNPGWDGSTFQAMWNIVWLLGYFPVTNYFKMDMEEPKPLDMTLAETLAKRLFRDRAVNNEDVRRVYGALEKHAENGIVTERSHNWHGILLWDTRVKLPRATGDASPAHPGTALL